MTKLSEQLMELSHRVADWENQLEAAQSDNPREYEANLARVQESVRTAQAAFAAELDNVEDSVATKWRRLKDNFDKQVGKSVLKAAERKATRDAAKATAGAHVTEAYAKIAAIFAGLTAIEAGRVMLEARKKRAVAKSVKKALK